MARCNCSGSTCSCKLQEGNGIAISGSGSQTDPYVIDATGDIEGTVQFISTPTVEFAVTGSGTTVAPFQVAANAVVNMDELADVNDPTGPAEGEVPVWTTDHWEFKTPAAAPPGAINVGGGITGDGSAGAPIKASVSGIWGQGRMLSPPWPTDSTTGVPVYLDSNGQLRAKPYALQYATNAHFVQMTPTSGWAITQTICGRWGPIVFISAEITRTGTALSGQAQGDIGNIQVATLSAQLPTVYSGATAIGNQSGTGPMCNWTLRADKAVFLTSTVPNWSIPQNQHLGFDMIYLTGQGMEASLPIGSIANLLSA